MVCATMASAAGHSAQCRGLPARTLWLGEDIVARRGHCVLTLDI